jgi:CspA family cold shock protein
MRTSDAEFFLPRPFDRVAAHWAADSLVVEPFVVVHFASQSDSRREFVLVRPAAHCTAHGSPSNSSVQGDSQVSQGTIKKLSDKGFGFIKGDKGDIFFHSSSVVNASYETLQEGQAVEYSEGTSPKGPRAENVKVLG